MNTKIKVLAGIGIAALVALTLAVGGWFAYTAYAQTPTPNTNGVYGNCHNNQAVFDLLKTNAQDLLAQRQAGKNLLDIATAKGVSEQQLTDALLQPITAMHNWMGQNYPQSNAQQMTQYMRDLTAKDIRQTQYGTMTDFRLFGGTGAGMMGGNGYGGMMNGVNRGGGMMGGNGYRGMMGGRTN